MILGELGIFVTFPSQVHQNRVEGGGTTQPRVWHLNARLFLWMGDFAGKVGKMGETIHIDDNSFEKVVLKSPVPVLVDFWAPWCAPCRAVAPVLEKIAAEYDGRLLVVKVNVDDYQEWAGRYRVTSIPTLLLISEGRVVDTRVGALPYNYLKQMVEQILAVTSQAAAAN